MARCPGPRGQGSGGAGAVAAAAPKSGRVMRGDKRRWRPGRQKGRRCCSEVRYRCAKGSVRTAGLVVGSVTPYPQETSVKIPIHLSSLGN